MCMSGKQSMSSVSLLCGAGYQDMAVIMTAYKDFDFIEQNLNFLHEGFDVYLHVDRKADIPESFIISCKKMKNVWVDNTFLINWGGYEHLKAVINLIYYASNVKQYNRFVIMSENEASLYSVQTIKIFFNQNRQNNYIGMTDINNSDNSEDRINSYHFQHKYDIRDISIKGKVRSCFWRGLQVMLRKLNIRPHYKHKFRYKGYLYCALNNSAIEWLIVNKKIVIETIEESKYLYVAEEYVLHNLFMEDASMRSSIVNDSLIFDDWTKPELGTPRMMTKNDYENILKSGKIFFRKIGSKSDLLDCIYSKK